MDPIRPCVHGRSANFDFSSIICICIIISFTLSLLHSEFDVRMKQNSLRDLHAPIQLDLDANTFLAIRWFFTCSRITHTLNRFIGLEMETEFI